MNSISRAKPFFSGEIEVDESYFAARCKGKRGPGAGGKAHVSGLFKRGGKVDTKVIPDASSATQMLIRSRQIVPDGIVYTDCWRGHNVLDASEFKHVRINRSKLFADQRNHLKGIENVKEPDQAPFASIQGVPRANFELFLKACEWRLNNPYPKAQFEQLKQWVAKHQP